MDLQEDLAEEARHLREKLRDIQTRIARQLERYRTISERAHRRLDSPQITDDQALRFLRKIRRAEAAIDALRQVSRTSECSST